MTDAPVGDTRSDSRADELVGLGVSSGVASGPVARMARPPVLPANLPPVQDAAAETAAANAALAEVAGELRTRAARVTGAAADVLAAQALMAQDPMLAGEVGKRIEAGMPGPQAVLEAFGAVRSVLESLGGYMAERVADLDDLADRTVAVLLGLPMPGVPDPGHPFVLVARDLAPADTATLDPTLVLAVVTELGGPTSHTAILAKALGIPAIVACPGAADLIDAEIVIVDGNAGTVRRHPEESELVDVEHRRLARAAALAGAQGPGPALTLDGTQIKLLINVGSAADIGDIPDQAEGIGLFRTEFQFLSRTKAPTVAEQRAAYATVFEPFRGRKVVVRTLDAGADKPLPFLNQAEEPNPALGVRGLRLARERPEVFADQLQAIALAATDTGAHVWVMAPMVSVPSEAEWFVQQAHAAGLSVAGVMIEVPAAAMRAADILAVSDFVSIGTNDLAQYLFAADRMGGSTASLLDPWQPALLRLVGEVAQAGIVMDKPVSVCGEAASDPLLACVLVGAGVTSLSMAPASLAEVKVALGSVTIAACRAAADAASSAADPQAARVAAREILY